MTTPIYVSLNYKQYKEFEEQFKGGCGPLETLHCTEDQRFYHKAIQFAVGDLMFEVTGPMVMGPQDQAALMDTPESYGVDPDQEAARDARESEQRAKEEPHR